MNDYKPGESDGIIERISSLERQLEEANHKLDKLIQSNKSLIAYFNAVNERDARDLNYRIRGYSKKGKHLPPIGFVAERVNSDL